MYGKFKKYQIYSCKPKEIGYWKGEILVEWLSSKWGAIVWPWRYTRRHSLRCCTKIQPVTRVVVLIVKEEAVKVYSIWNCPWELRLVVITAILDLTLNSPNNAPISFIFVKSAKTKDRNVVCVRISAAWSALLVYCTDNVDSSCHW